jgi:hypothetical protein
VIIFRKGPRSGSAIILDKPVNGVVGVVECNSETCEWRLALTIDKVGFESNGRDYNSEKIGKLIDDFLMKHRCGQPPRN